MCSSLAAEPFALTFAFEEERDKEGDVTFDPIGEAGPDEGTELEGPEAGVLDFERSNSLNQTCVKKKQRALKITHCNCFPSFLPYRHISSSKSPVLQFAQRRAEA